MILRIFNVEHGACAILAGPSNAIAMIDCGHNSTSGWRPSNFLAEDTPDGKKANVAYFGPGMHAHGVIVDGDNIVLFKGKFPKEERLTVI